MMRGGVFSWNHGHTHLFMEPMCTYTGMDRYVNGWYCYRSHPNNGDGIAVGGNGTRSIR